jgi:hypothetical protein
MPEHCKLLYCKDFYTASNFYSKNFQLLKKSDIAKRADKTASNLEDRKLGKAVAPAKQSGISSLFSRCYTKQPPAFRRKQEGERASPPTADKFGWQ